MAKRKISLELPTALKLRGLHLLPLQGAHGLRGGEHRSRNRGFSSEFAEHREYVPGDDLRHLDWKVFGKTDKYYLKQFEDETNLHVQVAMDVSSSMAYPQHSHRTTKYEFAAKLALCLAWIVLQQQDSIGLTFLEPNSALPIPPRGGMGQLPQLQKRLEGAFPEGKQSLSVQTLHDLAGRSKRRGMVCLFSDFLDPSPELIAGLAHLRSCHQEVLAFQILDPAELTFPFEGTQQFIGLEEESEFVIDAAQLREEYLNALGEQQNSLRAGLKALRIEHHLVQTDQDPEASLGRILSLRSMRGR